MWWRRRPRRSEGRSKLSPSSRPSEAGASQRYCWATPGPQRFLTTNIRGYGSLLSQGRQRACCTTSVRSGGELPHPPALHDRTRSAIDATKEDSVQRCARHPIPPRSFPYVLENRIIRARYCTCGRRIHFRRPGWKWQHQPRRIEDEQYSRHPVDAGRQGEAADDRREDQAELLSLARAQRTRRVCSQDALRLTSSRRARRCGSDLIVKQPSPLLVITRLDRVIQYAATYRLNRRRLWNTGSPG